MPKRSIIVPLRCSILLLTLLAVSCRATEKRVDTPRKVKCEIAVSSSSELESSLFPGKVVATTDVNLGFRVAGIIEEIVVEDGAFVREGEVIALMDSRDYELQKEATLAEYTAIKSEVDRVVALYAEQSVSANDYDKAINGLRAITAKLEAHTNALSDCTLRAPIDCYIVKSNFARGEAVAAGTPVVGVISAGAPQITIDIPAVNYLKHSSFESATASIELIPDTEFNLKLKSVSPKGNLNQLYRVTFGVEPTRQGQLPAVGMSAMVTLNYNTEGSSSVEVPFSSIVERAGDSYLWVVEDGVVKSRKVTLSKIGSDGIASIKEGLSVGERVVVAGVNSLKEGESVTPLAEPSLSNIGGIE